MGRPRAPRIRHRRTTRRGVDCRDFQGGRAPSKRRRPEGIRPGRLRSAGTVAGAQRREFRCSAAPRTSDSVRRTQWRDAARLSRAHDEPAAGSPTGRIDTFLGLTAYSLQNHLRTQVEGVGQIEIDEIYIGIDKEGRHYAIPIQAKGGSDKIGSVQVEQDIRYVTQQFPSMKYRAIAAQFMPDETVALFELTMKRGVVKIVDERHYRLVPASEMDGDTP